MRRGGAVSSTPRDAKSVATLLGSVAGTGASVLAAGAALPWLRTPRGDAMAAAAGVMTGKATGEAAGIDAAVPPCRR